MSTKKILAIDLGAESGRGLIGAFDGDRLALEVVHRFPHWMTGIKGNEFTNASTTQMIDPATRGWARALVRAFGIPEKILGSLVQPGTVLGPLRPKAAAEAGVKSIPVIAPATHDTAA